MVKSNETATKNIRRYVIDTFHALLFLFFKKKTKKEKYLMHLFGFTNHSFYISQIIVIVDDNEPTDNFLACVTSLFEGNTSIDNVPSCASPRMRRGFT